MPEAHLIVQAFNALDGLGYTFTDLVSEQKVSISDNLRLEPYQFMWLRAEG